MLEEPEVIILSAFQIFDYIKFYDPVLDEALAYYQEPHQFRFKVFKDSRTPAEVVLVHYKQWAQSALWLPCDILLEDSAASGPACSEQLPKAQSPASKKRKMSRHSTTKGQLISQVQKKLCLKKNVNQTHNF